MEKLKAKLQTIREFIKTSKESNEDFESAWFNIKNIPLTELRAFVDEINKERKSYLDEYEMRFDEKESVMRLQLSFYVDDATIFLYSEKVKMKTHFVVDEAIKNV